MEENMYQKFLLGGNKVEEAAFLAGCRTMMEIFAHAPADGYSAILSRNDPDWILFLCEQEAARKRREQQQIAAAFAPASPAVLTAQKAWAIRTEKRTVQPFFLRFWPVPVDEWK